MTEFEANAEPLQDWLNSTEVRVQESSARLHDLPAKKQELSKLQVLWSPKSCSLADFILSGSKTILWLFMGLSPVSYSVSYSLLKQYILQYISIVIHTVGT